MRAVPVDQRLDALAEAGQTPVDRGELLDLQVALLWGEITPDFKLLRTGEVHDSQLRVKKKSLPGTPR